MKLQLYLLIFNVITYVCSAYPEEPPQTFCLINNSNKEVAIGLAVGSGTIQYSTLNRGDHMHGNAISPSTIYFTFNLKRAQYRFNQVRKGPHKYPDIHQVDLPEGDSPHYYLQLKNEEIVPQVATWLNWLRCRNVNEDGWPLDRNKSITYMKLHDDYC